MKTFGGNGFDVGRSITTTPDGGYILTGNTSSYDGDFNKLNNGGVNIFVIKLDSRGNVQWKKIYGGSKDDIGYSITTTPDGGYVLTGSTVSHDGDFKGRDRGYWKAEDVCVIKLDQRGNIQWSKSFGGSSDDRGFSINATADGGYILTGTTNSNNGEFKEMGRGENEDIFIIKLDERGDVQWKKFFGDSQSLGVRKLDVGRTITTTSDSGFVMTGWTPPNDDDFEGMNRGVVDIFVIKLDSSKELQWKKTFGGSRLDEGHSITTTPDGGYVLTGKTESNSGDFEAMQKGGGDIFIIKLDERGDVQWKKTFGGSTEEESNSITTTSDGGYVLTGSTRSVDADFKGINKSDHQIFVMKLDSNGNLKPSGRKSKKK